MVARSRSNDVPVVEDVQVDPHLRRLVEARRVERDRGRAPGPCRRSPASPETTWSSTTPCWVSWIAVSWKSAGVGAGGVVSTKLHADTASATSSDEAEREQTCRGHRAGGYHRRRSRRRRAASSPRRRLAIAGAAFRVAEPGHRVGRSAAGGATGRWAARRVGGAGVGRAATAAATRGARAPQPMWRGSGAAPSLDRRGRRPHRGPGVACAGLDPLAAQEALGGRGPRTRGPAPSPDPAHPAARRRELAPPDRHPPQGDVERPQQQREDQQQRPQVGEPVRGGQVVHPRLGGASSTDRPPVAARSDARNGSLAPSGRYSAAVGATSPTVRPSGDDPGSRLRHPDRVRARRRSRRAVPRRRPGATCARFDGRAARGPARRCATLVE